MYLMNNLCMLWSLLEDMYINIGYRPATAALQSVWAKAGELRGKKKKSSAMDAKYLQFICILLLPLLITLKCTLNTSANAVTIQCKCQGKRSAPQMCTHTVCMGYKRCVRYILFINKSHIQYYCRCVSTSMSVQRVMQESTQLAEVINQASQSSKKLHCTSFEDCSSSSLLI